MGNTLIKNIQLAKIKTLLGVDHLTRREKIILTVGVLFILSAATFQLVIQPYVLSIKTLNDTNLRKEQELVQIRQLHSEYLGMKQLEGGLKEILAARSPTFSLFTFLDKQATSSKVKDHILYMKPSKVENTDLFDESIVEIKLQKIPLKKLVHFLSVVESSENAIVISRMSIQTNRKELGLLDVTLRVITYLEKAD